MNVDEPPRQGWKPPELGIKRPSTFHSLTTGGVVLATGFNNRCDGKARLVIEIVFDY